MFEAYKIGVKISVINHASLGLAALSKSFLKTEADAAKLQARIASIQKMALKGGLLVGLGAAGLSLFKTPLAEAKQYQVEMQRLQALGFGAQATQDAIQFSRAMKTYGTSALENLTLVRDAMTIFADPQHAKMVAPLLAKMKFANQTMFGEQVGSNHERTFMNMLKVIELRGGLASETRFEEIANLVQRVITATGGRVGPNEWLNFIKTGGVAAKSLRDTTFFYQMEPLIQEMGGYRVGTGLMSAYNNLYQGRSTVRSARAMMRLGLLDPNKVEYNKIGMLKQIKPGALLGGELFKQSPLEWLEKVLLPKLAAKGITTDDQIKDIFGTIFGNRTAANLFTQLFLQRANIHKSERLNAGANDIPTLYQKAKNTAHGKEINLLAKKHDLYLELGKTVLPIYVRALALTVAAIKRITGLMQAHTTVAKGLTLAFVALAGGLAIRGTVLLLAAAFRGLGLAMLYGGLGVMAKTSAMLTRSAVARSVGFLAQHLVKAPLAALAKPLVWSGRKLWGVTAALGRRPVKALSRVLDQVFGALSSPLKGTLTRFILPALTRIGRLLMFGLRAIPIIGWAVMLVTLGIWLWRHWAWVGQKARDLWGGIGQAMVGAWAGIKDQTLFVWRSMKGALSVAFKTFAGWFLDQWQALFNGVLSGVNKLLPHAFALKQMTFADDYRRRYRSPDQRDPQRPSTMTVAPPIHVHTTLQLDGRQIAHAVTRHQTQAAQRAAWSSGSQPDGSRYVYSPAQP